MARTGQTFMLLLLSISCSCRGSESEDCATGMSLLAQKVHTTRSDSSSTLQKVFTSTPEYGTYRYSEYYPGTLPLLLSAPHGGQRKDRSIQKRGTGCCASGNCQPSDCTWPCDDPSGGHAACEVNPNSDYNTKEITLDVADAIFALTGERPHVVVLDLHRSRMDASDRTGKAGGAQGNWKAEVAWDDYHGCLEQAKSAILEQFGHGLLLDIHGNAHDEDWIELGYLLSAGALDGQIQNADAEDSSIRHLAEMHVDTPFEQLLRGEESLGGLLSSSAYGSYRTVPSPTHPGPNGGKYFNGGYITGTYSSELDAIQIELPSSLRSGADAYVQEGVTNLAAAVVHFLEVWYDVTTTTTSVSTGVFRESRNRHTSRQRGKSFKHQTWK